MVCLKKFFGMAALLALSLSLTGIALAQDEAATEEKALEEVLVTAQKKEEGLRDVPSSVATLSDEKLDAITSAGQDIRLLSSRVPSLHVESSFGRTLPRFYIRGLGNTDFDLNASQPVSQVYDGIVLENPILKGYPIYDLDRVEVLRGPQGTLFGRNTPAGIVKFESRKPTFEPDGFARLSYGVYNTAKLEAAYGGPVAEDMLAVRASFLYQGRSDWVNNTYTKEDNALGGYQDFAGRLQFLLTPGDKFNALLNLHMRDLDGTARLFQANIVESGSNEIRDGFKRDEIAVDGQNEQTVKNTGGVLTMDYDLENMTLTSITGVESGEIFSRGDIDGGWGSAGAGDSGPGFIPFASESADGIPDLTQITQELRLASSYEGPLNFLAGFFYFDEDLKIDTFNYITEAPGSPQSGYADQHQQTQAWALFGTMDYRFNESWKASGGIRYSDEKKDFMAQRTEGTFGGPTLDPVTDNRKSDFTSWDLNLLWTVNPDVNVYGRAARSFRAPSFQGRVLFGDAVTVGETEKILSFEVGTKMNMGAKARGNLSVYSFTMNDQQLTIVGGQANFNQLVNAEETAGRGVELELDWLPMNQLFLTLGYSFNYTEIKDSSLYVGRPGADGVTVLNPEMEGDPNLISIDGNRLPNAPETILNATLRFGMPAGDNGEVFLYTDWAYRSKVDFFLYRSIEFSEDGLVEGGLRIGYTTYDRVWEVAVFGRNLTDDLSRTGGIDFNNLTGFVNEPRTFGVELRRTF